MLLDQNNPNPCVNTNHQKTKKKQRFVYCCTVIQSLNKIALIFYLNE